MRFTSSEGSILPLLVALFMLCGANAAVAATVTIDFEEFPEFSGPPTTQGYVFGGASGVAKLTWDSLNFNYCPGCEGTMAREDGGVFTLFSFDIGRVNADLLAQEFITITGRYATGGEVQVNLSPGETMSTVVLGAAWSGLDFVTFGPSSGSDWDVVGIDNIVVSAVPIPAAVWLFGSALAGLGWLRRKQNVPV